MSIVRIGFYPRLIFCQMGKVILFWTSKTYKRVLQNQVLMIMMMEMKIIIKVMAICMFMMMTMTTNLQIPILPIQSTFSLWCYIHYLTYLVDWIEFVFILAAEICKSTLLQTAYDSRHPPRFQLVQNQMHLKVTNLATRWRHLHCHIAWDCLIGIIS